MKKIINSFNYLGIGLLLTGFALWRTFGAIRLYGPVLFFLGLILLGLYVFSHRHQLKSRNMRMNFIFAGNLFIIIILIIAVLAAVNYLGTKVSKRFDLSEGKIHSLAEQSVQVVKNLKHEISVKGFFTDGNPSLSVFRNLMDLYRYYSDKISVETIDPVKNPALVKHFDIKRDGTLVLEYQERDTRIEEVSEEAITNALIKLTRSTDKTVYFIRGHGEPDLEKAEDDSYSEVKSNLEKLAFQVKELVLFQEEKIPDDADVVVVAGPEKSYLEAELSFIEDYLLQRGGRLLLMLNPFSGDEFSPLLEKFGVRLNRDVVVETSTMSRFMSGDAFMPVVSNFPQHELTKNFNYAVLFPFARSLSEITPAPEGVQLTFVAVTSPQSWGETSFEQEKARQEITRDERDLPGPLNLVAAIEKKGEQNSRVVLTGNADFAQDRYYYFQGNGNFFNNVIAWLAEEEDLIAISPKTTSSRTVHLTQSSGRLLFFYTLIILPLFVFMAGIAVWFYRRRL